MELTQTLLTAAFLPGLVAAVLLLPWQPWSAQEAKPWVHAVAAVGVLAGFILSIVVLEGFPEFPPVDAGRWVPFIGIASLAAIALPSLEQLDWVGRLLTRLAIVGLTLATIWQPLVGNTWELDVAALHFVGATVLILIAWEMLGYFAKQRSGAPFPLTMMVLLTGISVITVLDEALKYGVLLAALAATQGAAVVIGLWGKRYRASGPESFVLLALVFAMLASTHAWSYFEPTYDRFVLYFVAMIGAGAVERIRPLRELNVWPRELIRLSLVVVPLGCALALSLMGQETDTGPYYY